MLDFQTDKIYSGAMGQRLTPLHYLVGGLVGTLITKLIYGELTLVSAIVSFVAWPAVFVFGFFVLIVKVIGLLIGVIF